MTRSEAPATHLQFPAEALRALMADLFAAAGVSRQGAERVAEILVEADLQGLPSHGVMQAEGYLTRLKCGAASTRDQAEIVINNGCAMVLDAHDMLGQLSADQAMRLAVTKAKEFGAGIVAVRRGCHFGAAGYYADIAADEDCIGLVMANTSPVMPAPGGRERLVGTNPVSVAIPTEREPHVVLDMATTEGSVAKIRIAARDGKTIPDNWAVRPDGTQTTDPNEALKGLLLPSGGPKGFGLSLVADLMGGLLSSGAWGAGVYGNAFGLSKPHNSSHLFVAIHTGHFRPPEEFRHEAQQAADRIRATQRVAGVDRVYVPGERKWDKRRASGGLVKLEHKQIETLHTLATEFAVDPAAFLASAKGGA